MESRLWNHAKKDKNEAEAANLRIFRASGEKKNRNSNFISYALRIPKKKKVRKNIVMETTVLRFLDFRIGIKKEASRKRHFVFISSGRFL